MAANNIDLYFTNKREQEMVNIIILIFQIIVLIIVILIPNIGDYSSVVVDLIVFLFLPGISIFLIIKTIAEKDSRKW